jgi:hypothetical protein
MLDHFYSNFSSYWYDFKDSNNAYSHVGMKYRGTVWLFQLHGTAACWRCIRASSFRLPKHGR